MREAAMVLDGQQRIAGAAGDGLIGVLWIVTIMLAILADGPELDWCHVDAYDDVPLNAAVRSGAAVVGHLDDLDRHYSDFIERQRGTATVAIAAQPITSADQTLGGFVLYFDRPQSFDHRQRARLAELGAQLGGALRRALHVVEPAQLALPDEPTPPGASVASHEVTHRAAGVVAARLEQSFLMARLQEQAATEERIRLARDLHDGVLQSLTGIALRLVAVRRQLAHDPAEGAVLLGELQRLIALAVSVGDTDHPVHRLTKE